MSDFQKHLEQAKSDPEFRKEYEALAPQYELARQIIAARLALGISQEELAKRVGTSQANISKLEHASLNPSLAMVERIAQGLGKKLSISIQ